MDLPALNSSLVEKKEQSIKMINDWVSEKLKELEPQRFFTLGEFDAPDAKKNLASLRKVRDKLDNFRKDVKKEFLKSFDSFESEVKKSIAILDDPIEKINKALKNQEEQKKNVTLNLLVDFYERKKINIPFEKIFEPHWLNFTQDFKKSCEEMNCKIESYNTCLAVLQNEADPVVVQVLQEILEADPFGSKTPNKMINRQLELKTSKVKVSALKDVNSLEITDVTATRVDSPSEEEEKVTVSVRLTGTVSQLKSLNDYAMEIGVSIDRV